MYFILLEAVLLFILMVMDYSTPIPYNPPESASFSVYGPGVLLTIFFPLIWGLIVVFCRGIAAKNREIAELEKTRLELEENGNVVGA